jgi:hypothetical protein
VETNVAAASAWFQFLCLFELHLLGKNSKTEKTFSVGEKWLSQPLSVQLLRLRNCQNGEKHGSNFWQKVR